MLIMLYSDTNYVLNGFKAEFSLTNCLHNCSNNGLCLNHNCLCTGDYITEDCSVKACDCGDEDNRGFCNKDRCECRNNYSGQTCSLHKENPAPSQWHWLTNGTNSFTKRAAHTAIYNDKTDSVYIFGGYDLNNVIGLLEVFRFKTGLWEDEDGNLLFSKHEAKENNKSVLREVLLRNDNDENRKNLGVLDQFWFQAALLSHVQLPPTTTELSHIKNKKNSDSMKPEARYSHAACSVNEGFLIYGGKLASGKLSNELWFFNISSKEWSLRANQSAFIPPKLSRHTLTFVGLNNFVYLVGGALENGEFSSRMFRVKMSNDAEEEQWEEIFAHGGKTLDYRVVAHTTNYHDESGSLIIYGGIVASGARLSKLSDRIFSFNLIDHHWAEIFYPKTILREMSVPRERAYHTATITGSYLIIFGGYSHRHNKEEICYDNQMYLYNLDCHIWINQEALGANRSNYPKKQGVFAHAATLRGNNTLLILGGYHGNVNEDFFAFTLPDMMIPSMNLSESEICMEYKSSTECIANPICGWCSSDASCYGRTMSNCFTNLQSTRCPGICSTLKDCQSCLIHGSELETKTKFSSKLPIGKCTWCVQNAKCHQKNDYEPCGESDSVEKIVYQYWGKSGVEIEDKKKCTQFDKPPGLVYMKYFQPFDMTNPDFVSMINSTLVDFSVPLSSHMESSQGGVIARLHGFLHLPPALQNQSDVLKICGSYANIFLKASNENESVMAANFTAEQNLCVNSSWNNWNKQKVLIDLQAMRKLTNPMTQQHYQSKVSMISNATKALTFEFLEPFSKGNCNDYISCLACLTDNDCGWCDLKNQCVSRNSNEAQDCNVNDHWRYLVTQPDQCPNCSNFVSCESCTGMSTCEWWTEETKCVRKGRSSNGIKDLSECPTPCFLRSNCSNCLSEKGRCVWCESTNECFSFSVYISEYQFGICKEWIDYALTRKNIIFLITYQ